MARKPAATDLNPTDDVSVEPDPSILGDVAPQPQTDYTPATASEHGLGGVTGEFTPSDIKFPELNVVYGTSKIIETFNVGDLVLGKENLLVSKGEPLNLVILGLNVYWKEYLSQEAFAAKIKPREFRSKAEVLAAGGTVEWINGNGPTFAQAGLFKLLIEKPEGVECSDFGIELDGRKFAVANWHLDKKGYQSVGPEVLRADMIALKPCSQDPAKRLWFGNWEVKVSIVMNKQQQPVPTPKIRLLPKRNSPEFVKQVAEFFGTPA